MSTAQKTPLFKSANQLAENRVADAMQRTGKALPCSVVSKNGSIVTVKFEVNSAYTLPNVTIPMFGPIYIRYPIQPGDKGMVVPADARLSGVSGIGGGTADLSQPGNLTGLVFLPIANTAWSEVDPNAVVISAPNGVVLTEDGGTSMLVLTPSGIMAVGRDTISITSGSASVTVNNDGSWSVAGDGAGSLSAEGGLTLADGSRLTNLVTMQQAWNVMVEYLNTHIHAETGGNTTPPVTPFTGGNIVP